MSAKATRKMGRNYIRSLCARFRSYYANFTSSLANKPPATQAEIKGFNSGLITKVFFGNLLIIHTLHSIATAVAGARVIWCAIEIVNIVFTAISNLNILKEKHHRLLTWKQAILVTLPSATEGSSPFIQPFPPLLQLQCGGHVVAICVPASP